MTAKGGVQYSKIAEIKGPLVVVDDVDTYCSPQKQYKLLKLLVDFYRRGQQALKEGASLADIRAMSIVSTLLKARMDIKDNEMSKLDQLDIDMKEQFKSIIGVKVTI